jgi:hypothetical protein
VIVRGDAQKPLSRVEAVRRQIPLQEHDEMLRRQVQVQEVARRAQGQL